MKTMNGNRSFDRIYRINCNRMDRMGGFPGQITGGEVPVGLGMTRLNTLNHAWSGLITLKTGVIFCPCARVFAHGHYVDITRTRRGQNGDWKGKRESGLHRLPPLGRKIFRGRFEPGGWFVLLPGVWERLGSPRAQR
ncbi:MAG: hypothetical protein JWR26_925 [Pedosphaera sp.]|nr:hypothetical protein [Pedosphaera sp.]